MRTAYQQHIAAEVNSGKLITAGPLVRKQHRILTAVMGDRQGRRQLSWNRMAVAIQHIQQADYRWCLTLPLGRV